MQGDGDDTARGSAVGSGSGTARSAGGRRRKKAKKKLKTSLPTVKEKEDPVEVRRKIEFANEKRLELRLNELSQWLLKIPLMKRPQVQVVMHVVMQVVV